MIQRKSYKTDPKLHYLNYKPILDPKICVVLPAYNEVNAIEDVVKKFQKNKYSKIDLITNGQIKEYQKYVIKKNDSRSR